MKFLSLFLILLVSFSISAQFDTGYDRLTCSGPIPDDFRLLISDKYGQDIGEVIQDDDTHFEKKSKDKFVKASYAYLQQILGSGKVLFGDPITNYLNKVTDEILKDEPDLRNQIQVYTLKSSAPNAFATEPGIIMVTTALMASFDTEAELAYVLCHEIAHYTEHHNIDGYVQYDKVVKRKGEYRRTRYDLASLAISNYSKSQEFEADELGAKRFLSTEYNQGALFSLFDVLNKCDYPFEQSSFDLSRFETEKFKIPERLKVSSVRPFELELENEDDELSSHPNSLKRRIRIRKTFPDAKSETGSDFLVSEEEFNLVKTYSKFETIRQNLLSFEYGLAIANINAMLKQYPNNEFLKRSYAKAFYGAYKFKSEITEGDIRDWALGDTSEAMGIEHEIAFFLRSATNNELRTTALRLLLDHPDIKGYNRYEIDLINDMIEDDFYDPLISVEIDHKEATTRKQRAFNHGMLKKYVDNQAIQGIKDQTKQFTSSKPWIGQKEPYSKKQEKWLKNYEHFQGLDKVLTVAPQYSKSHEKRGNNYLGTEYLGLEYSELIKEKSEKVELENTILNPLIMGNEEVDNFNDMAILNEWINANMIGLEFNMIPLNAEDVLYIKDKRGTSKILYTGVINEITRKTAGQVIGPILVGALFFPILPITIYAAVNPNHETLTYYFILDTETSMVDMDVVNFHERQMDAPLFIESQLHHYLHMIKTKPRKAYPA